MRIVIIYFLLISHASFGQLSNSSVTNLFKSDTVRVEIETNIGNELQRQFITITHRNGNWFRVQYMDTKDKNVKRVVHKNRLNKFSKRIDLLTTQNTDCDAPWVTIYFTSTAVALVGDFLNCESKQLKKMLRTLKIW